MAAIQEDSRFVTFNTPEYGIRAMARILLGDFHEGDTTVSAIIHRWAPPIENDTGAYVAGVAQTLGVDSLKPLQMPDQLLLLIKGIVLHENGQCPYPPDVIQKGIDMERYA